MGGFKWVYTRHVNHIINQRSCIVSAIGTSVFISSNRGSSSSGQRSSSKDGIGQVEEYGGLGEQSYE